jgi:hypothetical protein
VLKDSFSGGKGLNGPLFFTTTRDMPILVFMADRKARPLCRRSRQRRAGSPATKAARARFIVGRKGTQAAARSGFWA